MSGRRNKKSKYYSRSYSKPLFDPQRLLYFSTTNQRIGKVIRPKSSAVNNSTVITKRDQRQVLDDLNETKSYRLQRKGKEGFPTCYFTVFDTFNSIDIQHEFENNFSNYLLSFPFSSFKDPHERTDTFLSNFQPYTPSLCSPYKVHHKLRLNISQKQADDVVNLYAFILKPDEIAAFTHLPDEDALNALVSTAFYHMEIPLNDMNKGTLEIRIDSSFFKFFNSLHQQQVINNYVFNFPSADNITETETSVVINEAAQTFPETQLSNELQTRFKKYLDQLTNRYEMQRIPTPGPNPKSYSLVESLEPEPLIDPINDGSHLYICFSAFIIRTTVSYTSIPFSHEFELEAIEINPYLNEQ